MTTYYPREPEQLAVILGRLDRLVVKPATGSGGEGIVIGPTATATARDAVAAQLQADPRVHRAGGRGAVHPPTWYDAGLKARHINLRLFVLQGRSVEVVPGGLTRVALRKVRSSRTRPRAVAPRTLGWWPVNLHATSRSGYGRPPLTSGRCPAHQACTNDVIVPVRWPNGARSTLDVPIGTAAQPDSCGACSSVRAGRVDRRGWSRLHTQRGWATHLHLRRHVQPVR